MAAFSLQFSGWGVAVLWGPRATSELEQFEAGIVARRKREKLLMEVAGKWTLDATRLGRRARRLRRRQAFACAASQGWIDRAGRRRWLDKVILDLEQLGQ